MNSREDLFQNAPISKSVFQMAIPTVISSLVLVIYNMADTFLLDRPMTLCRLLRYLSQMLCLLCIWRLLNYWELVGVLSYPFFWVKEKMKKQKCVSICFMVL